MGGRRARPEPAPRDASRRSVSPTPGNSTQRAAGEPPAVPSRAPTEGPTKVRPPLSDEAAAALPALAALLEAAELDPAHASAAIDSVAPGTLDAFFERDRTTRMA